jgi:hypothetical protein
MRQLRANRIPFLAALSAAAIAAGCGGGGDDVNNNADDYDGTDGEVAGLVDDFANAGRDGDGTKICDDIFSKELAANVEKQAGQSCASEVEDNLPADKYELEIDSLELKGETATVAVTDQDDNSSVLHIQKIDNVWRVASVTPAP